MANYQPKLTEHERRQLLRSAIGDAEGCDTFVAPDTDKDLQAKFPFGKHEGLSLGQVLEMNPGYLAWVKENVRLYEGPFAASFYAVIDRYKDRIESAARFRRAERF